MLHNIDNNKDHMQNLQCQNTLEIGIHCKSNGDIGVSINSVCRFTV